MPAFVNPDWPIVCRAQAREQMERVEDSPAVRDNSKQDRIHL